MRTANLRAFFPTGGATAYTPGKERFRLDGRDPIFDVHGCSGQLTLNFRGELLNVAVTSVAAGTTTILKRPGQRDVAETFPNDGIVLDVPIPARPEMLRTLRGRLIQLDVDFAPKDFDSLSGGVATARVAGLRLAKAGERGDRELRLID